MEVFVVYLDNAGLPPNTELSKSEQTCLNLRHLNKPRRSEPKRPGANQRNLATPGRASRRRRFSLASNPEHASRAANARSDGITARELLELGGIR